jgi:hypothetical protein
MDIDSLLVQSSHWQDAPASDVQLWDLASWSDEIFTSTDITSPFPLDEMPTFVAEPMSALDSASYAHEFDYRDMSAGILDDIGAETLSSPERSSPTISSDMESIYLSPNSLCSFEAPMPLPNPLHLQLPLPLASEFPATPSHVVIGPQDRSSQLEISTARTKSNNRPSNTK